MTKNKKRVSPFPFFVRDHTDQLKQGSYYEIHFKFQTLLELIIIKSYKRGKSISRIRTTVTSKIKFFLKTVNSFQLLNIVSKNSVLDVIMVLALPLHIGQTVFTHLHI